MSEVPLHRYMSKVGKDLGLKVEGKTMDSANVYTFLQSKDTGQ
jgi:hypothetical protein